MHGKISFEVTKQNRILQVIYFQPCHDPWAAMCRLMSNQLDPLIRSNSAFNRPLSERIFSLLLSYINNIWRKAVINGVGQWSHPSHHTRHWYYFFFHFWGAIFQHLQILSEAKTQVSETWSKRRMFFPGRLQYHLDLFFPLLL